MSDPHGLFPQFEPQTGARTEPQPGDLAEPVAPAAPAPPEPVRFEAAPSEAVLPRPTEPDAAQPDGDGFDRGRVLRLLERLERDVAAVETAMVHVEAGEHEAYAAAVATIDAELVD